MTAMSLLVVVAVGPQPTAPDEPWPLFTIVRAAVRQATQEDAEIRVVPSDEDYVYTSDDVHAVVYEEGAAIPPPWSVPTARVNWSGRMAPAFPQHDSLDVSLLDANHAARLIAEWLRSQIAGLTADERKKIEVVVKDVLRNIERGTYDDKDPAEVAQAQAAVDTVSVQLRAPRPSRRIVRWALGQLPGFVLGSLSGVSGNYLTELLHVLS